jgi:uridine kinase
MVVAIDLPLDISLARRLLRDISTPEMAAEPQMARDHVASYCQRFLHESRRELILAGQRCAVSDCDLLLDGTRPADALIEEFTTALRERG